ncbi:MAG: hypothetical protein WCZ10_14340 [Desulfobulbaceae bacterium]
MKKYALFYAPVFKAKCGWRDFKGWYDDAEKAASDIPSDQAYWWQVIDTDGWKVIAESYNQKWIDEVDKR